VGGAGGAGLGGIPDPPSQERLEIMMNKLLLVSLCVSLGMTIDAVGQTPINFLKNKSQLQALNQGQVMQMVRDNFEVEQYREVRVQPIYASGTLDHFLVYLFKKGKHRVDFASLHTNSQLDTLQVERDYALHSEDFEQQPGKSAHDAVCPDTSIQFISFAPNNDSTELGSAKAVAKAANAANLKTIELYTTKATRDNYINYMACPNLLGNFYDGDANPSLITTVDGVVNASDFSTTLKGKWNYKVTNIWLACEAYNDPMLSAVQKDAQARKYAAGENDLDVGPSDAAGACAMEAAIAGKPMTAAFQTCYKQYDNTEDQWGFGGDGSDNFWD
jgi:hypothetical protein